MDERMTCEEAYYELGILCNRTNISRNAIDISIINDTKLAKISFPEALDILKMFYDIYTEHEISYINLDGIETRVALVYRVSHDMIMDGKLCYALKNLDIICHAIVILISVYIFKYDVDFDGLCRHLFNTYNKILIKNNYSCEITEYSSQEELKSDILRAMTEICAYYPDLLEYNNILD